MKNKIFKIWTERIIDEMPDLSWLDQFENSKDPNEQQYYKEDQKHKAKYGDTWYMLGIVAYAEIGIPFEVVTSNGKQINYKIEKISSGGLWGIESDSDESYFKDIEQEQLADLKEYLKQLNVSVTKFDSLVTS
jgi:hypothetical protein